MIRNPRSLTREPFDVVVVGGGIFGACVAWEATSRGLSVALVERGDFAHATSSNSYKIAHGGIRYLQHGDVPRVRESSRERSALLRVAPHLVHPVPIVIPTYGRGMKGKPVLRAGFGLYDALTWDRNRAIRDPARRIPAARFLSRTDVLEAFPDLPPEKLTGGAVFCDGQMYSPPRLVLAFLRAAGEAGATACNYMEATGFLREGSRVVGVAARDVLNDRALDVRASVVVNAAGPWASLLLAREFGVDLGPNRPSFSRDVGLVVRRQLHPHMGLACPTSTRDAEAVLDRGGRHLFLLPWRDRTLVGVWHGAYSGSADEIDVTRSELREFVLDANQAYPGLGLREEEVSLVITGLILFGGEQQSAKEHRFGRRSLVVDHAREHGIQGLLSVVGVRATVARGVAEKTVDRIAEDLPKRIRPSRTTDTPVYGGDFHTFESLIQQVADAAPNLPPQVHLALAHNHGSRFEEVLRHVEEDPRLKETLAGSRTVGAEVVHAVRHEMAQTLEDAVLRRTDLGTAGDPGEAALLACAKWMAQELGWDEGRVHREVEVVSSFYTDRGSRRMFEPRVGERVSRP